MPSCHSACLICARLRSATLELVGDGGLESATLARMAEAAGISEARARRHYDSAAECVWDTYEVVARSIYEDFAAAFGAQPGWRAALAAAAHRLLARMAAHPDEARLCFVEAPRGDHELLRRRVRSRQRLVSLFARELHRRRRQPGGGVPEMQLELLIGAGFQAIAASVAEGSASELPAMEPELHARARVFEPSAA